MDRLFVHPGIRTWSGRLTSGVILAGLLLWATLLQGWRMARTPVPAPDCIRLVAQAQAIDSQGLLAVLPRLSDPPLFPTLVAVVHRVQERLVGGRPEGWGMSAQLVAAAAAVASIVPLAWLLGQVFDRATTAWACALFATTSHLSRQGADGLADSTHLCLYLCALSCAGQAVRATRSKGPLFGRSTAWAALTGMAVGTALWARAEALVLYPAVAVVWLGQGLRSWRQVADRAAGELVRWSIPSAALFLGVCVGLVPYVGCVRARVSAAPGEIVQYLLRGRPESRELLGGDARRAGTTLLAVTAATPTVRTAPGLDGAPLKLSVRESTWEKRQRGYLRAAGALLAEWATACDYLPLLLALVGCWTMRRQCDAAVTLWLVLAGVYLAGVWWVAAQAGYLSTRHLLPLLPLSVGFSVVGARRVVNGLSAIDQVWPWWRQLRPVLWVLLLGSAGLILSRAPLHASRSAHRQAGEWLARQAGEGERVLDTQGFSALYSGRPTYRVHAAGAALADAALAYVVVEARELEIDSPRGHTLRRLLTAGGRRLVRFEGTDRVSDAVDARRRARAVEVYRWQPEQQEFAEHFSTVLSGGARQLTGSLP